MHEAAELATLRRLNEIPTAPFYEADVLREIRRMLHERFGGDPRFHSITDAYGNLAVRFAGSETGEGAPTVAFAAHVDHPGLHVTVGAAGDLVGTVRGGLPVPLLPGAELVLSSAGPPNLRVRARVVRPVKNGGPSRQFLLEPEPVLCGDEIQALAFGALRLGALKMQGELVQAGVLDDYAAVAMMLEALTEIASQELPIVVYLVFHRAEEVGFVGACGAARDGLLPRDALVYSVEMSSYLARAGNGERVRVAEPGAGPVIRTGDGMTPAYNAEALCVLREAALFRPTAPVQQVRMWGGSCEASLYYAFGYRAAGVCLPLMGAHNDGRIEDVDALLPEAVYLADLLGGTRLISRACELLASRPELFPSLGKHRVTHEQAQLRNRASASLDAAREQGLM